jgi:hypothetical protein
MDQMWRKTKLQGLVWLFVGIDAKFKEKNEKKKEIVIDVKQETRLV